MTAVRSGFAEQFETGHIRNIQDGRQVASL
jgi:hypothetical protein